MINQLWSTLIPKEFRQTWVKFAKGVYLAVQKAELYETKWNETTAVKNARKSWERQANKVLQFGAILYAKNVHDIWFEIGWNWKKRERRIRRRSEKNVMN